MHHNINPGVVEQITHRVLSSVSTSEFSTGEVILGLAEALGRVIVAVAKSPVEGVQCARIMEEHVKRTLVAGYTAKGYNMGDALEP